MANSHLYMGPATITTHIHIRWMIRRDMVEILHLEQVQRSPWSEDQLLSCFRQLNCIGMVAEVNDVVVGYMIYELFPKKLEVLKVVGGDRTVLDKMLSKLASKLSSHRRNRVAVNVDENALYMHLTLKRNGYDAVRVIKNGEADGADSYRFVYRLPVDAQ